MEFSQFINISNSSEVFNEGILLSDDSAAMFSMDSFNSEYEELQAMSKVSLIRTSERKDYEHCFLNKTSLFSLAEYAFFKQDLEESLEVFAEDGVDVLICGTTPSHFPTFTVPPAANQYYEQDVMPFPSPSSVFQTIHEVVYLMHATGVQHLYFIQPYIRVVKYNVPFVSFHR